MPSWLALATGLVVGAAVVPVLWAVSEWVERMDRPGASKAARRASVALAFAVLLAARPMVLGLAGLAGHGQMDHMLAAIPGVLAGLFGAFLAMAAIMSGDLRRARRMRSRYRARRRGLAEAQAARRFSKMPAAPMPPPTHMVTRP